MRFHLRSRRAVARASASRAHSQRSPGACVLVASGFTSLVEHGVTGLSMVVATVLLSNTPLGASDEVAEVPFELHQHHLIVTKGSIGPLNGLNLLIDTGTIPSVVDDRIARKLRLRAEPSVLVAFGRTVQVRSAVVDGIRIGSLQTGSTPVGVGDLSYLAGLRVDAIVGLDVLARTNFSIDYDAKVLRFASDEREALIAPMEIAWPFITVEVTIAGEQVRLLIDTGSRDLVLFKARMPAALSGSPWKGDKTVRYASGSARLVRLELRQVGLGAHTWDKLEAWSLDRALDGYPPDIDGVLGVLALGCRRLRFDFTRGELGCGVVNHFSELVLLPGRPYSPVLPGVWA